ncbi:hypothetical protein QBC34DRAFT_498086 [Podospora aff. communis PSN243]|uniref:Major facilitator superfamily (MFS) profile domain-containing protein n=1 Tax=Podospora aff. communis PSN243 TaxID=3040156 RepID=A0AAV9GC61_9PEZI|nr:hypothetical protein QBC34DRAFT_498086 [Podospora aff. communis PSN243]
MAPASLISIVAPVLTFTALLTFADSVSSNALPLLNPPEWRPGFWNFGSTNLIISGLAGQLVTGYIADRSSKNTAMNVNASSLLASSIVSLFALVLFRQEQNARLRLQLRVQQQLRRLRISKACGLHSVIKFNYSINTPAGVTLEQAQTLWLTRTAMSIVIVGIILPTYIPTLPRAHSSAVNLNLPLYAARAGIITMGLVALLIGASDSLGGIIAALIINTLGVATDLSLLAFASNSIPEDAAGRILMLLSSVESSGTLLGVGFPYPIYQWSMREGTSFVAGGLPYYICAVLSLNALEF